MYELSSTDTFKNIENFQKTSNFLVIFVTEGLTGEWNLGTFDPKLATDQYT